MGTLTPHNTNKNYPGDKDTMKPILTIEPDETDADKPHIALHWRDLTARHSEARNLVFQHYAFAVAPWFPISMLVLGFAVGGFGTALSSYEEVSSPLGWGWFAANLSLMGALSFYVGLVSWRGIDASKFAANACPCHDAQLCPDESPATVDPDTVDGDFYEVRSRR